LLNVFSEQETRVKLDEIIRRAGKLSKPYRVTDGRRFRLKDFNPSDSGGLDREDRARTGEVLRAGVEALCELQERLYAQDRWALLLIFQAMDAAGKDSAIKHVMTGVNPQGVQVYSFKKPSDEELDHDFLWRCLKALPERGRIGIFNRSYYEELLVVRVHPELLERQRLPRELVGKDIWKDRAADICAVERYLSNNGIVIRKFFLHVSKREQKKRFLERLDRPEKNWKFSAADLREREHWREYHDAYEDAIRRTATAHAPWYVVPADRKWFTRIVVVAAVIETLAALDLRYPVLTPAQKRELLAARRELLQS
jgi:PPK2 family polyphosphate:nucleotide phosphotransferase